MTAPDPLSAIVDELCPPASLQVHASVLAGVLDLWRTRDDTKAQAEVREAANLALDEIDSMLAELHQLRARLVTEMRASDEATAARVDALIEQGRERRRNGAP